MLRGDKTQTLATRTNWQSPPRHKCWQPSPWWPRRAIALSLPREVNLPGWPEGGQLWSRSALNKQSARAEEQETEKTAAALTITLHPSIIPLTPTQSCEMQPSHSPLSLSLLSLCFPFYFSSSVPSRLELQRPGVQRSEGPAPEWANVYN